MQKKLKYWEIAFKAVQIKLLAIHITNKNDFNIFTFTKYPHGTWSLINILLIFDIEHFDPNNVFLAIATNIAVLLMTGFVVQDHI